VLRCDEPKRLQAICDGLSAEKIYALLRKWLRKLPHPFTAGDRKAGYRYEISILQAEFSLTQVLDRPVTGRVFFEEVIRENLDIGRPSQVQLIFDRNVGDQRAQALFAVLVVFSLQLRGFTNAEMRALLAQLLGLDPANYPQGRKTYDLRRLRLHGIIERIPRSHRYQLTPGGLRIALFFSRVHDRLLRPTLATIMPQASPTNAPIRIAFDRLQTAIDASCREEKLVA